MPMLGRSIRQNSIALGVFALATAGLIALIYQATATRIADAQYRAAQRALLEIVPARRHNNDLLADTIPLDAAQREALGIRTEETGYMARMDGEPVAVILPSVAPDGYSGDIAMIIGINRDGSVAGVRVLNHRETPGLGDKLELTKSPWILRFDGKSLNNPLPDRWQVKKDGGEFDQFTGATITPRAVVRRVQNTLRFFEAHQAALLGDTSRSAGQSDRLPDNLTAAGQSVTEATETP